ncbi:MAG: phosphoenolpyruvate carboxykinase (ATP) [Thermoguttaceae bacterium]
MFDEFHGAAGAVFESAARGGLLIRNPDMDRLKALALEEPEVRLTKYGSIYADSEPMSRVAKFTRNNIDDRFGAAEGELLEQARRALAGEELVSIDVAVGDGTEGITARLIVPRRFAHVAYGGLKLFKPAATDNPTYQVVLFFDEAFEANKGKPLPQKDVTVRLAHAPDGRLVKFVRNSNYFGEWKKGVFAGEDYRAKLHGDAIFLHAACRKDTLENRHGAYVTTYSLIVALSANGKTSTSCRILARKGHERSWVIQDDGGTLLRDGRFRGFEAGGLFVKTDCLNPGDQREAYYACLRKDTFLENVAVNGEGSIDFYDLARTSNGRAVVQRRDFVHTANDINAKRVDNLFLITRGNIIPAVAKLTHQQAAAFMVLGQSMESSAGDPTQAGAIKNEFFYDPFVAGDRSEHANLFYDILQANPRINCYLLNTGGVGEGASYKDITLADTMGILDSLFRGGAEEWVPSPKTGLVIPRSIRAVDSILMRPEKLFAAADFTARQRALDRQRAEYLENYPGLEPKVKAVFQDRIAELLHAG